MLFQLGGVYICPDTTVLNKLINLYNQSSTSLTDSIIAVYMCPRSIIANYDFNATVQQLQWDGQDSPIYIGQNIPKINSLNGYKPKNNKLLTFPYCYLTVSNNNGSSNNYRYENFNTSNCIFQIKGVPTTGSSIKCLPYEYNTTDEGLNEDEGLIAGKYPTLSWSQDEYINWLTQNSVNIGLGITSNLITAVGGIATGNPVVATSAIISSGMGIANQLRTNL